MEFLNALFTAAFDNNIVFAQPQVGISNADMIDEIPADAG